MLANFAGYFDQVFLLQLGGILAQLALRSPVLAEHYQATGTGLQRQALLLAQEVAMQDALGVRVMLPVAFAYQQVLQLCGVAASRAVHQQGDGLHGVKAGIGVQLDALILDLELRVQLNHLAVHRDHPAPAM